MTKKAQSDKKQEIPHEKVLEITLDHIKYNLYLNFKALCAQIVASQGVTDPDKIAIEADRLAAYLDKVNKPGLPVAEHKE